MEQNLGAGAVLGPGPVICIDCVVTAVGLESCWVLSQV